MKRLSYNLENLALLGTEECDCYPRFSVTDGESTLEVITNRAGEGHFSYDEKRGCYDQLKGTMQYRIPRSKDAARRFLKKEFEAFISDEQ